MKYTRIILATAVLLITGCIYDYPLTTEHNIPINPELLGFWEAIPVEGGYPSRDNGIIIMKFSDTEYLIHSARGSLLNGTWYYYRGYHVKIGNFSCVQLQIIGTEFGPSHKDAKDLFHIAFYTLENGNLEIKMLNTNVVSEYLYSSEALRESILENQENKDLFKSERKFKRVRNYN